MAEFDLMNNMFGWFFKKEPNKDIEPPSFAPKETDDGSIQTIAAGGSYGVAIDLDGTVRTDNELITRYREMSLTPECDMAIDEITNESIEVEEDDPIDIILDDIENLQGGSKKVITESFKEILELLNFKQNGYDLFRRWYIDGRLYFHVIINDKNPAEGIQELRLIDPRKIKKIREVKKKIPLKGLAGLSTDGALTQTTQEYFVFSDKGFYMGNQNNPASTVTTGLKISKDAILYTTSGLTNAAGTTVLSYLHKAIKPLNQLRILEDASLIYRLSRAPERRIWYIDVGNLPKLKAEQYLREMMTKHKNKLVYDATSGEITDSRKFMTIMEDYWLPRRDGRGTEVDTLPAGQAFQIDDIELFQKKLLNSLHVPFNRLNPDMPFMGSGTATEISRDEVRFGKFIQRLRNRFSQVFTKALGKHLVLKGLITLEEWEQISKKIRYRFAKDNFFVEAKNSQVIQGRMQTAQLIMPLVGRYYSNTWVRKNILKQSDDEIEENDMEIREEMDDPILTQGTQMLMAQEFEMQQNPPPPQEEAPEEDKGQSKTQLQHEKGRLEKLNKRGPSDTEKLRSVSQKLAKR